MLARLAFLALLAGSGPAPASVLRSVAIQVGDERTGYALPYMAPGGCAFLTAAHVAAGRQEASWLTPIDGADYRPHAGQVHAWEETDADASDVAIIDAPGRPASCTVFPRAAQTGAVARRGAEGLLELAGAAPLPVRIEEVRDDALGIASRDPRRPLQRGHSGAPVWIGDVPVGILKRIDLATGRAVVVRLEACGRVAKARWIEPGLPAGVGEANALFRANGAVAGSTAFREGLELALLRNSASARLRLDAAARLGSAAGAAYLGEMLSTGEGGNRDPALAAAIRDVAIDRLVDALASRGEPEAAYMLVFLNARGRLAATDRARVAPLVRRTDERLRARERDGEAGAATWRALMGIAEQDVLGDTYARRVAPTIGRPAMATGPEPLLADCADFRCVIRRAVEVRDSALAAARAGDTLGMLLVGTAVRYGLAPADDGRSPPECAPWRSDGSSPVIASAYMSCLGYRRIRSVVRLEAEPEPAAYENAIGAAVASGAVGAVLFLSTNPDQRQYSAIVRPALLNASEQEGSLDALLALGVASSRWSGIERDYASATRLLEEFVARTPTAREGRGVALGRLAAMYDMGGFGLREDEAAFGRTVGLIRDLPADEMNLAAQQLGIWTLGDPLGRAAGGRRAEAARSELLRLAADKGSLGAAGTLANLDAIHDPEAAEAWRRRSVSLGDLDSLDDECQEAVAGAEAPMSRSVAEDVCDVSSRVGVAGAAARIVEMYADETPPSLARASRWIEGREYRRNSRSASALARLRLKLPGADVAAEHAVLRASAADYDANAAIAIVELMLDGRLAWDPEYAKRLVRLFVFDHGSLDWLRRDVPVLMYTVDGTLSFLGSPADQPALAKSMRRVTRDRLDLLYRAYVESSGQVDG